MAKYNGTYYKCEKYVYSLIECKIYKNSFVFNDKLALESIVPLSQLINYCAL